MAYEDAKHRPHGIHTGEEPRNPITNGPESLSVTLDRWGPTHNLFTSMYDALQANWGDEPSRTVRNFMSMYPVDGRVDNKAVAAETGWDRLDPDQRDYVEACFAGRTLQQVLEGVTFDFCIDGVSRAFTHQNVRTRLGAGFMQHGGRDNDWRHRSWTMPETMRRMCAAMTTQAVDWAAQGLAHCITNWDPVESYLQRKLILSMRSAIERHIQNCRDLYAVLVDAGIPWQDARRVLPIGMQTYIHDQYNYLALQGVLANRLEHVMDWEFNCVAQLMLREIKMKCPPLISKYLGSHSDKAKQAKFAGLESWPPDRKYPSPYDDCERCGHAANNHHPYNDVASTWLKLNGESTCDVCDRHDNGMGIHRFIPKDRLPRQHRPEQMPFFVLHPDSMAGGPIVWIPTNGEYPHAVIDALGR